MVGQVSKGQGGVTSQRAHLRVQQQRLLILKGVLAGIAGGRAEGVRAVRGRPVGPVGRACRPRGGVRLRVGPLVRCRRGQGCIIKGSNLR